MAALTGAPVLWLQRQESPRPRFTAGCNPSWCSLTGRRRSSIHRPVLYGEWEGHRRSLSEPNRQGYVLCVDEKAQIKALDRTQPLLQIGLGFVEGVTHDYIRHGTTTLFAALDVATGEVITQCKPRHRHQEFLWFLRQFGKSVPVKLDIHLVVDNYCILRHALARVSSSQRMVRSWLAQRPCFHVYYPPTYAAWLDQVERWFGIITRPASFSSVKGLVHTFQRKPAGSSRHRLASHSATWQSAQLPSGGSAAPWKPLWPPQPGSKISIFLSCWPASATSEPAGTKGSSRAWINKRGGREAPEQSPCSGEAFL